MGAVILPAGCAVILAAGGAVILAAGCAVPGWERCRVFFGSVLDARGAQLDHALAEGLANAAECLGAAQIVIC